MKVWEGGRGIALLFL